MHHLTDYVGHIVTAVTDVVEQVAQEHRLEMHTLEIVSLMIFAAGSTMRVEEPGSYSPDDFDQSS
jgi:hypothetical protein